MAQALLQIDLEQTIDRSELEEASARVPAIARGDCARLSREICGVVAENLSEDDARAFQAALQARGFPTRRVEQVRLPSLGEPVKRSGIRLLPEGPAVIDGMRRETFFRWEECHFLAGGFVQTLTTRTERNLEWQYEYQSHGLYGGGVNRYVGVGQRDRLKREERFRLELYLGDSLERFSIEVHRERFFFWGDQVIRLRQRNALEGVLRALASRANRERMNLGLLSALEDSGESYPSVRAFEREIVWHFYRLAGG